MKKIRVAIAGLGTVGKGVYDILKKDKKILSERSGYEFEVTAVSARSKKDFIDPKIKFYENPLDIANDINVDIVVELMGGYEVAKKLLENTLKNNKKFVTANKALLAEYGFEIAKIAEKYNGVIGYEASTAGANPIIKSFKEGFIANEINEIYAILNGTCNFILTKMKNENQSYDQALNDAKKMGYAEADPTFDVDGIDTAHKIVILSAIANSSKPDYKNTYIQGISNISINDINLANQLGYKIKLLAIYKNFDNKKVQQSVYPALIKASEKIAQIDGSYNAILSKGSNFEWNMMIGRGAGGLTTGSAVVADIVDVAKERNNTFLFNIESANFKDMRIININERIGKYFIIINFPKTLVKNSSEIFELFPKTLRITQATFNESDQNNIQCALVTEIYEESKILSIVEEINTNFALNSKFIRIEEINF